MVALVETPEGDWEEHMYSEQNACTDCGIILIRLRLGISRLTVRMGRVRLVMG